MSNKSTEEPKVSIPLVQTYTKVPTPPETPTPVIEPTIFPHVSGTTITLVISNVGAPTSLILKGPNVLLHKLPSVTVNVYDPDV